MIADSFLKAGKRKEPPKKLRFPYVFGCQLLALIRFAGQDKAGVLGLVVIKVDNQLMKALSVCFLLNAGEIKHVRGAAFPDS